MEKHNTEWPFLTAIFDSPDVAGFSKIIALLKSNHDVLLIFRDHFASQNPNANNPFKAIPNRTRKSKDSDNIDDEKLTKIAKSTLQKIVNGM